MLNNQGGLPPQTSQKLAPSLTADSEALLQCREGPAFADERNGS